MSHDDEDFTRSRRVDALRGLSEQGDNSSPAAQSPEHRSPKRTISWRWRLLAALILVALIVVGSAAYLALRPRPTTAKTHPIKPVVIQSVADGMACWNYVTWSPTSTQVALFGHHQNCNGASLLNIYDAGTGKLATQIDPAKLLATALPQPDAASTAYFSDIAWSPDGQRLALVFGAHSASQAWVGVLLTDTMGQHAEVVTRAFSQQVSPILPGVADLTRHTVNAAPALPPALGYRWGANGALAPETPLSASAPPAQVTPGPMGSPVGERFTLWQPGWVDYETSDHSTGQVYDPGVYTWYSTFLAWSPDGRYLRQLSLGGRLMPPEGKQPSAALLKALNREQSPILPVRDSGLRQVMDIMTPNAVNAQGGPGARQSVAWRPDGKYLATQAAIPNGDDSAKAHQVVVYDCATGKIWDILHPDNGTQPGGQPINWLRWSPDGTRLLVADSSLGAITIWGPGLLPT
ncbi:MAG TPA: WD40 repeat domain-containing protein [Ktedonobacterales bacterium]